MAKKGKDLEALERKRKDILDRLSRLEEKKEATKPQIFGKVKDDYEDKLNKINEDLKGEREAIEMELEEVTAQKGKLSGQKTAVEDELEELILRHSIGEYTDKEFAKLEEGKTGELKPIEVQLEELEAREQTLKRLIQITEPVQPKPAVEAELAVEPELAVEAEPAVEPEPAVELEEPVETEEVSEEILAEEKALKESEKELEELIKELEESGVEVSEPEEPLKIIEKALEQEALTSIEGGESILTEDEALKEELETEEKGLVCKKCGTVNKPDSWYCEKCGAELIEAGSS